MFVFCQKNFVLKNVSYSQNLTNYSTTCNPYNVTNETEISTVSNCTTSPGWYWNNYTKEEFSKFDSLTLQAGQKVKIKIVGRWSPKIGFNSREWIPRLKVNSTTYEQTKWAWWNTSYSRCRNITLYNPKANYPMFINVSYDSDMQTDFDDVRFANQSCDNDGTELSYFRREKTNSSWASFDVRVDSGTNNTVIAMYYGNSNVSTASDANNTWGGNMIHYWGFDEGGGTNAKDFIDSTYNGTLTNGPTWNSTWRRGKSVDLDGVNDLVNLTKDSNFPNGSQARTVELWVSTDGTSSSDLTNKVFFRYGTWLITQSWIIYSQPNGSVSILHHTDNFASTNTTLEQTSQYHIVGIYTGTQVLIYVNGTAALSATYTPSTTLKGYATSGGDPEIDSNGYIDGRIDEIRVYSNALNYSEINNHYSATEPTYSIGSEIDQSVSNEAHGRAAIEDGLKISLGNNIVIYTDQQIYTRNLTNYQQLSRFDKVTKYGNQIWAFNYYPNASDTFTNMPNITPSFYVMELANKTASEISTAVSNFINQTKAS